MLTVRQAALIAAVLYFVVCFLFLPLYGFGGALILALGTGAMYVAVLNLCLLSQIMEEMSTLEAYLYLKYGIGGPERS